MEMRPVTLVLTESYISMNGAEVIQYAVWLLYKSVDHILGVAIPIWIKVRKEHALDSGSPTNWQRGHLKY